MKSYILDLDRERELRFGFKATRLIRQKFGNRNLDALMNIKVDEVPILVWAGLKWEDKQLTLEQVEDLLDDAIPQKYTILKVTGIVLDALATQMGIEPKKAKAGAPVVEKKKAENPKPEVAETEEKNQPTETTPSTKKQKK